MTKIVYILFLSGLIFLISIIFFLKKDACADKFILISGGIDNITSEIFEKRQIAANKLLKIDTDFFCVAIANTDQKRNRGLSFVENLDPNIGMLFIFSSPDRYKFWMKDTFIDLDIVWLNTLKKIIHIKNNASPESYPNEIFIPETEALYVLELNASRISDWESVKVIDF